MTPYLVAAPEDMPVSLAALKAHLRVAHNDDDAEIGALQAGVVALLDGWGGILGRCIMPQTWAVQVTGPGPHILPFPDAVTVTVDGEEITPKRTGAGLSVMLDVAPSEAAVIEGQYALPEARRPTLETLVKLMVGREFDRMAGPDYDAATRSIEQHIAALRWRRV